MSPPRGLRGGTRARPAARDEIGRATEGILIPQDAADAVLSVSRSPLAPGHRSTDRRAPYILLGFIASITLLATFWPRFFQRGPLEWLMGMATGLAPALTQRSNGGKNEPPPAPRFAETAEPLDTRSVP